jgi:ArsR family transcriptional regulator
MDYETLTQIFKALAHPTRLQILDMLRCGEICVCHIETALGKRQAYVSQQLMILRESGLVEARKDGLSVYYQLADPRVIEILETMGNSIDSEEHQYFADCPCPMCIDVSLEKVR